MIDPKADSKKSQKVTDNLISATEDGPSQDTDESVGDSKTLEASLLRSEKLWGELDKNPGQFRVLTGDRPTGNLHIGHYFGSIQNRVRLQNKGVNSFIIIADYQVFTDRDTAANIDTYVQELVLDYLACGLDPENGRTHIFCHSHIPALNQLMLPFLTLVSMSELDRNPTVKEEIKSAHLNSVNAAMYTYPIHQAADILFCKGNVVPVGKDQLPHLELTRKIARRFNERFAPVFPEPQALMSEAPMILGLDGGQKMSKSRGNTIPLKASAEDTAKLIKGAKTDANRQITWDPASRPEVANLLKLLALCSSQSPEVLAQEIGDGGGGKLKNRLTEAMNAYLSPIRERRKQLEQNMDYVRDLLKRGNSHANQIAEITLTEVRKAMKMVYYKE